eukprot:7034374-Ditylum_brightwellii.AAC.1
MQLSTDLSKSDSTSLGSSDHNNEEEEQLAIQEEVNENQEDVENLSEDKVVAHPKDQGKKTQRSSQTNIGASQSSQTNPEHNPGESDKA